MGLLDSFAAQILSICSFLRIICFYFLKILLDILFIYNFAPT